MTKSNILVAFRSQLSDADAAAHAYTVSPAPLNLTPRSLQNRSDCLRSIEIHEPNPLQSQGREMHPQDLAGGKRRDSGDSVRFPPLTLRPGSSLPSHSHRPAHTCPPSGPRPRGTGNGFPTTLAGDGSGGRSEAFSRQCPILSHAQATDRPRQWLKSVWDPRTGPKVAQISRCDVQGRC